MSVFSPDSIQSVSALSKDWKSLIRKWEEQFELHCFEKPKNADKMKRGAWYARYKSSHAAVELLREKNPPLHLKVDFQRRREEAKQLVQKFLEAPHGRGSKETAEELARGAKVLIREWEAAFELCFELDVSRLVKQDFVGDLYKSYNDAKGAGKRIGEMEDKFEAFRESWKGGGLAAATVYSLRGDGRNFEGVAKEMERIASGAKGCITEWQQEFEARAKRDMASVDKRTREDWFALYAEAKDKLKLLAAAKKVIKELDTDSKNLLRATDVKKSHLVKFKAEWKKHIKEWEKTFLLEQRRPPETKAKLAIKQWYLRYKQLGERGLELDREALERMQEGGAGGENEWD